MNDQPLPMTSLMNNQPLPMTLHDEPEIARPRADARHLLARRQRRTRRIRNRVIAASVAAFATAWAAIGVQLASGHDPTLAQKSGTAAKSTQTHTLAQKSGTAAKSTKTKTRRRTSTATTSTAQAATPSSSASSPSISSQPLAPVTTRQS